MSLKGTENMIAIGSDHGGFALKQEIKAHLIKEGMEVRDFGCFDEKSCDYPDYAHPVADAVASGECEKGILVCGTGIGMCMAANKHPGVRAALCGDCFSAKATREHNDANIVTLGARTVGPGLALMIVDTFLATDFSNDERHIRRIARIEG